MLGSAATPAAYVQLIMLIGCTVMGLSHIVQPKLWVNFFADLSARGGTGLVEKVMLVELWPALLIVTLHQVWSGPAIVLTVYGWSLLAKVAISLTVPSLAMRSMALAKPRAFLPGGLALLAVAAACGGALVLP